MLYIGNRPTINGSKRNIEVNIFDFDEEIYGESLIIYFHKLIRSDIRFNDLEELKQQLHKDKVAALNALNNETY
jgi:riboflavin kinase/FMN adenylyltransferase